MAYGKDVFCSVRNRTWGVLGDKIPMEQVDIPWHAVYFDWKWFANFACLLISLYIAIVHIQVRVKILPALH